MADFPIEQDDTFKDEDDKNSSSFVLKAIEEAKAYFRTWDANCERIDRIYSQKGDSLGNVPWVDGELDLFWASYEILKPAVYARPPQPVVATQFKDRDPLKSKTAELLERVSVSAFDRSGIDEVMVQVRDDLIFSSRGVMWLTYEADGDGQKVCIEHIDRCDFLHEPARKWSEVGWVARRAWLSRKELKERFSKTSGKAYEEVQIGKSHGNNYDRDERIAHAGKGSVWEVWHKADNRVYWVSEEVGVFLDEGEPHLKLKDFFPCPRPAYATLQRRTLIPIPDYDHYAVHFNKINVLTARIYLLLESVKLKGLIPAGGDVGDAIQELVASNNDEMFIPVPAGAMMDRGADFVTWLPIDMVAQAIQGLIEARTKLIDDYYQLSGVSDIMRGDTDAQETLGAQRIKTQMGSIRVREKIDELQRIAADAVRIAAEIIAENFKSETLLEMAQMVIHKKSDIEKQIKGIERACEQELKALADEAEKAIQDMQQQMMQGDAQQDPQQAQQAAQEQFAQQQTQIIQKYAPLLQAAKNEVPLEDIMKLLRDDRSRCFSFEIASDSTILTDELQEKQSRLEFLQVFNESITGLSQLAAMGEEGGALAGEIMNFTLAPYRAGRSLDSAIDNFIEAAPQLAANMQGENGEAESQELIAAQNKLAEAEMAKADAAMANVQAKAQKDAADAQLKQVELQQKMADYQMKAQEAEAKYALEMQKLQGQNAELEAKVNLMQAQTAEILSKIGLDVRKQNLEEYKAQTETAFRADDQVMRAEEREQQVYESERDAQFRERGEARADADQQFNHNQPNDRGR